MSQGRHLQAFYIPDESIAEYFAIPDDEATFVHASYDYPTCCLVAIFEHDSYPVTPHGSAIYRAPMPMPERNITWLSRLLNLTEEQARDWLIAKVAVFRGVAEADIEGLL
jgi:hypothetical protein